MVKVRLPDGRIADFPDDMPREQIKATITQRFPDAYRESSISEMNPEALAQIEANNRSYDDKSHLGWNVAGDALSGAGEGVLSGMGRVASGLTFGASDWLDRKTGGNLAALDDRLQRRADNAGVGTLNKVVKAGTEIVGNVAPSAAITRGLARAGVKSTLGQAAAGGGVGGALYGATASDKLSDLPVNTIVGGVGGTVGGAALHSAISGIGTVGGLFRSNVKKGMDYIRKTRGDEYLQNMIDEATQKGVSLAEVADERGLDMIQMARQQTPDAKYIIHDNIRAIKDARTAKANQYIDDTFGKGSGLATVEDVKSKAINQARPYYEGLNGRDFDPNYKPESKVNISGKLSKEQADELLKSEMQKVAGEVPTEAINNTPKPQTSGIGEYVNKNPFIKNEISNVRKDLTWSEGVRNAPDTSFDILNAVKKNIDDKINVAKRTGNNEEMARLVNIKNELVGKMDAVAPEYAEARKIYENAYRFEEAADLGRDILGKGLEQRPERFSAKFAKLSDNEKEAVRAGFWDDLRAKINTVNNPDIGWKSTLNPYAQRKIKMILGEQEGNRLIDFAKMRVKSTDNLNAMQGGSTTANNQTLRDKGIKAVRDLVTGKIESFLPSNNARNKGIARIMTNPSADLARSTYEQAISPQGWEAVYQALYNPRGFTKYNTALAAYLAGRELQQ